MSYRESCDDIDLFVKVCEEVKNDFLQREGFGPYSVFGSRNCDDSKGVALFSDYPHRQERILSVEAAFPIGGDVLFGITCKINQELADAGKLVRSSNITGITHMLSIPMPKTCYTFFASFDDVDAMLFRVMSGGEVYEKPWCFRTNPTLAEQEKLKCGACPWVDFCVMER